jgi:hypothetical protein
MKRCYRIQEAMQCAFDGAMPFPPEAIGHIPDCPSCAALADSLECIRKAGYGTAAALRLEALPPSPAQGNIVEGEPIIRRDDPEDESLALRIRSLAEYRRSKSYRSIISAGAAAILILGVSIPLWRKHRDDRLLRSEAAWFAANILGSPLLEYDPWEDTKPWGRHSRTAGPDLTWLYLDASMGE